MGFFFDRSINLCVITYVVTSSPMKNDALAESLNRSVMIGPRGGVTEQETLRLRAVLVGGDPVVWKACSVALCNDRIGLAAQRASRVEDLMRQAHSKACQIILAFTERTILAPSRLLDQLRHERIALPLIVVGSTAAAEEVEECLGKGAWDWVAMDQLWRLPAAVRRAIENQNLRHRAAELESLWAGAGHDVNNLLTAVLGHCELTLPHAGIDASWRRALEAILKAGELVACWMNPRVTAAAAGEPATGEADLNEVVRELEGLLRFVAGDRVELRLELAPGAIPLAAEPAQLVRVILNLVMNARDAMPEGGRLTVRTGIARVGRRPEDRKGKTWVTLVVQDTGKGIEVEEQPRIFDPFYTSKKSHLGLGMSTVRSLVERCGGYLNFASAAGSGTIFHLYFPHARDLQLHGRWRGAQELSSDGSKKILLVEHDSKLREILSRALRRAGYGVLEARGAEEALGICTGHRGSVDLLLTDYRAGRMNGRELADALRAQEPELKILYLSRCADGHVTDHAADFLPIPFKPTALLRKVQETLQKPC